jgi:hypothetical protein
MPIDTKREALKSVRQRRYLNKEFDAFRQDLVEYARTYYGDKIVDLSEASMGGLLMDMPAYIGDSLSFYLDHQFSELDPETAVENVNIERQLRRAGVDIVGAAPAVVSLSLFIEVPASTINGVMRPLPAGLPIIEAGTVCTAENGVDFELVEDIDFTKVDSDGNLTTEYQIGEASDNGAPLTFVLRGEGLAVSGFSTSETFSFGGFVPFRRITLSNPNVTSINNVVDSLGNTYYGVSNLAEDVIYKATQNTAYDSNRVPSVLQLMPAPYRYTTRVSLSDRGTTLVFGGGSADTLEDDALPDPSLFALPLYGKTTFSRTTLNPQQLLDTKTLGISASDVIVTVAYRYGGGLNHNVEPNTIRTISTLIMNFPTTPSTAVGQAVRASATVRNRRKAIGGLDAPTSDELKEFIPLAKGAQSRIVTKPDLLSRVYTMPADFGRVFRAAARATPNNPLSTQLYVICKDADEQLDFATDALKDNLRVYLNSYRMISDAIDIVDAAIVNVKLTYEVTVDLAMNKKTVLQQINAKLRRFFNIQNFHIDQPIVLSDIDNLIYNTNGVTAVNFVKIENLTNRVDGRDYSEIYHDIQNFTNRGVILPPPGGIYELKYPDQDIVGRAV